MLLFAHTTVAATFLWRRRAGRCVEFAGPWIAERRKGGTPWHPHHIAERYGLLVIIALGEGDHRDDRVAVGRRRARGPGWSVDAGLVALGRRRR